jgi:hypothetical protein
MAPPFLVLPWQAGVAGWLVVFGALIAEVVAGIVINPVSTSVAVLVLALPIAVATGFAGAQWLQARSYGAEPASRWHLVGIAVALVTWLIAPTTPAALSGASSAPDLCARVQPQPQPTAQCLSMAAHAMDGRLLAWWITGALIVSAALFARRSKIAAWATIPAAVAGSLIATHFLEALLLHYHPSGSL